MAKFKAINKTIHFNTKGNIDFVDLTKQVQQIVVSSEIKNGIVHVFAPHARGSLILTENDPDLLNDIKVLFEKMAPKH
jgi:secondary thiamine-phosphate synthase enzyme